MRSEGGGESAEKEKGMLWYDQREFLKKKGNRASLTASSDVGEVQWDSVPPVRKEE